MIKRRAFISLLGGAAAWPLVARAQQARIPVLGFVSFAQREATLQGSWYQAFHDGLRELGWIPGSNVSIEYCFADNDPGRLAALAQELVRLNPDVIFVPTGPALPTMKDATATIPIVFVSLGDPIAEGWVASLARPGANLLALPVCRRSLPESVSNYCANWSLRSPRSPCCGIPRIELKQLRLRQPRRLHTASACPSLSSTPATRANSIGRSPRSRRAVQRGLSCCPIQCSSRTGSKLWS
jgi:ABC transporter substrate binding protein